ncbi:LEAF RUST 10 DISEASE-RESISTANCE LOCUS RECEPTOR-LIKE PROTEIN KINASE-like 2.1 [Prunus yedoensis var. nudiflora]|uniref:non-specific serine/threonine protein kinase n=1 Tax=Prunus yedoensis var. nudiflora TaxID=2094558 RepID=A0A314USU9_PRUYE|nr:LEAF RUST 10 DISEASE-RESISTANCE LOCUS RECEPTOR-LIKE PROTEIN KINASE-like 2.1 [Prunus yedoensis var. nudiflora]
MHTLLLQSLFPLLLITSFLSINVELSLSQYEQHTNCSKEINCGGISLSYPFWGVNRANYCGPPGFEVECLENVPMINISSITYRILKTNSSAPSVTVARQDYWETICPPTYVNTNINFSLLQFELCLVFHPEFPPFNPVDTRACTTGVNVPVFTTAALALEANRTTIKDVVDGGFELGLQIDNVKCNSCVQSAGTCGFNTINGGFSCFCLDQAYASTRKFLCH